MENRTDTSNKMNMITLEPLGIIHFDGRTITLGNHNHLESRRIHTFILQDNYIYVCTYISKYMMKSYPKEKIKGNNVLKFDAEGNLLFKTGLLRLKRAFFGERKFDVSG